MNRTRSTDGHRSPTAARMFVVMGALSALYLAVEAVFQLNGKSICVTEGCKVVSQSIRFGDLSMVLIGLAVVSFVTVLAVFERGADRRALDLSVNAVLVAALAGEGFLVGYQLFRLHAVCAFCLSVLGIFVVLGLLRLLAGHREVLTGFGAMVTVLGLFALVLPAGGKEIPRDGKYILFYSPQCKHCAEIKAEIREQKLDVLQVQVEGYGPTLKSIGIEEVPTLLVNGPYEKVFLTGTDAIRRYLSACGSHRSISSTPSGTRTRRTVVSRGATTPAAGEPLNLFPSLGSPNDIFTPPPDEGLCKENAKCE